MTSVTREAMRQMEIYTPYNGAGDIDKYIDIYCSMLKLSILGIVSEKDWEKIHYLESKLFHEGTVPHRQKQELQSELRKEYKK